MKLTDYSKTKITNRNGKEFKNTYAGLKERLNDIMFCLQRKRKIDPNKLQHVFYIRKHFVNVPMASARIDIVIDDRDIREIICAVDTAEVCRMTYVRPYYYAKPQNPDTVLSQEYFEMARLYIINDIKHAFKQIARNYKIKNCRIKNE